MKLDDETQREIILAAINACTFPGKVVEKVCSVKNAVKEASIEEGVDSDA